MVIKSLYMQLALLTISANCQKFYVKRCVLHQVHPSANTPQPDASTQDFAESDPVGWKHLWKILRQIQVPSRDRSFLLPSGIPWCYYCFVEIAQIICVFQTRSSMTWCVSIHEEMGRQSKKAAVWFLRTAVLSV